MDFKLYSIDIGECEESSFKASIVASKWCFLVDFFAVNNDCNRLSSDQMADSCSKGGRYSVFFFGDCFKWEVKYCE